MSRGFQRFLVGLLAFVVLFGAFCILYPLLKKAEPAAPPAPPAADQPSGPADKPGTPQPPPAVSPTPEQTAAQTLLETMTLEEKVYQLFVVTPEALTGANTVTRAGEATQAALRAQPVGGLIYFAKNLEDRAQTAEMLQKSQSYTKIPLLLCVDEEGGVVSRLGSNPEMGVTKLDNMAVYGAQDDPQAVYALGSVLGKELRALGFNLDFAPVADVVTNPANTEIGPRAFSSDPVVAAQMVGSFVAGLQQAQIPATLKHFPGHGGTATDTHDGRSVTTRTLDELRAAEFLPFRAGIDAGAALVMVGHLTVAALPENVPSDLSAAVVTDLLRKELGFAGVIVTDSQSMGAITDAFTPAEAAVQALTAGVDLVLMPADLKAAVQGVLDAVVDGTLAEARLDESVLRILALKYKYGILA